MPLLRPVNIEPNKSGKSLSDLLEAGEIDAISARTCRAPSAATPTSCGSFPIIARPRRTITATKIFPIMHLVAIRRDIYEKHPPWPPASIALSTVEGRRSKMHNIGALRHMLPWLTDDLEEIDEVFGGDPWPYGVEPTGRRWKRWCNIWPSSISSRA